MNIRESAISFSRRVLKRSNIDSIWFLPEADVSKNEWRPAMIGVLSKNRSSIEQLLTMDSSYAWLPSEMSKLVYKELGEPVIGGCDLYVMPSNIVYYKDSLFFLGGIYETLIHEGSKYDAEIKDFIKVT